MKSPKLPADLQIAHLKARGVTFAYMTERDAVRYLETNHNYFRLRSFRRPFQVRRDGTYTDLDFGCLRDLFIIDMRLRKCLLSLLGEIDHYARTFLMKAFDLSLEDGYALVADFEAENGAAVRAAYQAAERDPYRRPLYEKDAALMPIWTFIELLDFPLLTQFFDFFAWHVHDHALIDESFRLRTIEALRKTLASGRPLLTGFETATKKHATNYSVLQELAKTGLSRSARRRKMAREPLSSIVTLLYTYRLITPETDMRTSQEEELRELTERIGRNLHFYERTPVVHSSLGFLMTVIDNWFPARYTF